MHVATPVSYEIDLEAERMEQRQAHIIRQIDVGDLLARVDDLILSEPDPRGHPAFLLARYYLDRGGVDVGMKPYNLFMAAEALDAKVREALDDLIDGYLPGEE